MQRLLIALVLLSCSLSVLSHETHQKELIEFSQNIVKITVEKEGSHYYGSGTFISHTEVLTNYHVIEESKGVVGVLLQDGTTLIGHVTYKNEYDDLALVQVTKYRHPTFAVFSDHTPSHLDEVWALGHPAALPLMVTQGHYQYVAHFKGSYEEESYDLECAMHTAPIWSGNSGGALIWWDAKDKRYELVGVPKATWSHVAHLSCAAPLDAMKSFVEFDIGW